MEDMKAVYALNQEKLEFNHKVLKEREKCWWVIKKPVL